MDYDYVCAIRSQKAEVPTMTLDGKTSHFTRAAAISILLELLLHYWTFMLQRLKINNGERSEGDTDEGKKKSDANENTK